MEFIKKLRNIIIVLTLVTIIIIATSPITVLGASDKNVPVITAYQNRGQLKPGQEIKFKIKDDTKICYIFYAWDRRTQGNRYETFKLPNEQSEYEYTVKAPMTTGLHEFSIAAQDQYGNISYWLNIPYTIVKEVSEVVDNKKPTLIFDTENGKYPYHESTISQEMPITLQAQDDSGIYYIAYKWTREIVQNDTGATLVFNKTNSKSFTTEITAPVESGDWFLLVYARDGANNVSNTYATKVTIKATDYTKLKEKLDSIKNTLVESDYENFQELQNAITEVNNMISQNKSSQKTVDAQLTKIESAIKNLQAKAVNRQELDNYINSLVSTDYKNWAELQRLITDAQDKSVTLQSEFNKRLQKVKEFSLEAKEIDTSKLDTLKQELAKLDKNDYTEKSWNEIQTKISNAEQQTLQSKFDKIVNEISLEILVKLPKITNVSSNPKYVAAESQVTISFETNMELNIESSTASINGKAILGKIEKVEENKYKFTYTVTSDDEVKGSISYAIKPVADNKGEKVEGKEVTGEISIADYITGIEITKPTKLQYEVDDIEMDLSEGKVTPIMASGKPQEAIDMNIEMISGFDTSSDGTKTITVTYKEQTATFEIQVLKKEISKNEFTLSSLEVDYDGTEKTVEITPAEGVGTVTEVKYYPIISEHEQEALEGKPVNAGKYSVKVSVEEGRKYKAINDFSIGTLTILQATPEYEVPKGLTAIYGKKLKDIQLPDKFTFQDDQETEVGTVGDHTFKVKYTPDDIKNYKIIENIDVIVTVIKAVPEYTAPQGLTAIYGQTLEDVKITDSKFKFQDELTTPVGDAGENKFLVTYTPEDTHNYEIVRDIEVTITVLKASAPEIIYPTSTPIIYGQKLEDSELVGGSIEYGTFAWQSSSFVPPAGTNNYIVIFTPNENTIKNYEEISVKQREIAIEVEKATYDMSNVKFEGSTITYDGNSHNIKITGKLPEGVTVQYEGNNKRDVGEYTVIAKFTGGEDKENYNEIPNMQATLKITPRTPAKEDLKYTIKSTEYSGETQEIEVTANDGIQGLGEITVKYNGNIDKPVNVGKYKVTVTIGEGTNYSATEQDIELGEYEITRKAPSKEDLSYSITSTEYTGKAQGIKVTAKDGIKGLGTITVKYNGSTDEPINAGTYKITVSIAEGSNYSATEQDIELENYIITAKTPSKEDLKYNLESKEYTGKEQEVEVTAKEGINGIGTITVKYNGSSDKPKDVKVYTVTVDIAEGTNYSSAQSIELGTFEITKKAPSKEDLKFDLTSKEYTGVEQEVEVIAEEEIEGLGKTITVKYDGNTKKPVNAGTYAITVDIDEGTNYSSVEGLELGDFTITQSKTPLQKDNFKIEGETTVEYDGQQHTIEVKAKDVVLLGTIKVSYYNDSNGEEVEAPTNVGTYTIKVTTEGATNYADVEDLELTTKLEITAVAITVKADDITAIYGEDKKELTCSKEVISGTLVGDDQVTELGIELKTYYNEREEEIEIGPKTPVGTYKIKGESTAYGNYDVTVQEGIYTITRKTPSGEDLSYDLTDKEYTGEEQEVEVTSGEGIEGLGTDITVKYNGSESKPKDVGEYKITVNITEGTNYSAVNGLELGTLKITRKTPTINELQYNLPTSNTYNGKAIPIEVTAKEGVEGLGKITIKYNGESTEPIDAKEYTVTVDISEGDNYSSVTDIELGKYTITQASIEKAEVTTLVEDIVYDGQEKEQKVTSVKLNEVSLIKDSDYTLTITYATYSIEEHKVTSDFTTNKPLDVGTYSVKILVEGIGNYTGSKTADAIMEIKPIKVDSISITTQPSKLEYRYGEPIVTDGGKLEVTYNNKKKETIDITTDMIQGELKSATTLGTQNVTIEYEGQTANYDITVKDYITKIEAKPSKVVYKVGEVFEKETLEVKIYKASKEGEGDVVPVTDEMLSECNFAVEGQKTITVSYIDNDEQSATKGQVFAVTFEIAVVPNETEQKYAMVLNGSSEVHIEVTPENANSYKDEGVTVYKVDDSTSPVEGRNVKIKITSFDNDNVEVSIDTTKLGKYKITYSTDNADDVTRIVYVEDTTAPVINLNKDIVSNENVDISEEENNNINIKFTREKATFDLDILVSATDNYDTPKNKEIEIIYTVQYNDSELKDIYEIGKETEPGVYVVNYTATDSSGNMSTKSITFTILDYPPTIYYLDELDAETVIKVQLKSGNVYNRYLKIGCDTENVTIRIRVDGKEENDYNGEILKDGTYTVKVVQNEYINSEEITFTIDTIPPKVSVNEETRTITFEDPSDVYKATLTTGDGKTTITIKDGEGNNNIKEDGTYYIDGTGIMVYTLNVEDKYGNAITPIKFILLK